MSFKEQSPDFYQYYPKLFHGYFPAISETTVQTLSEAGFLYYQSILHIDAVIDDNENNRIFDILNLQERAIKKLSAVYPEDHEFWLLWDKRKSEFIAAIQQEKGLWENPSFENYCDVADKKAAFAKIAIDSCYVLDNPKNTELYNALLESQYNFSVAYQLYDDVTDFKKDFVSKQFNRGVYELSKVIAQKNYDVEALSKLFYLEGVASKLLNEAASFFNKAIKSLPDGTTMWRTLILDFQKAISVYEDTVNGYVDDVKAKK